MEFRKLGVAGLVELRPHRFSDDRGYFAETYRASQFAETIGPTEFVQENLSLSVAPGTIRGIHFQTRGAAQGKLVRCLVGRIFDVVVDLRGGSPDYGKWTAIELCGNTLNELWVPPGFGHGFCTLEPNCLVAYSVTAYYSAAHDKGLRWNDPAIGIDWPDVADAATVSVKDREQPLFAELPADLF